MSSQMQLQWQIIQNGRQRQMDITVARQQFNGGSGSNSSSQHQMQSQSGAMGSKYEDLPILEPADISFLSGYPPSVGDAPMFFAAFEAACWHGPLSIIQSIVSTNNLTPAFLHHGLTCALRSGHVEISRCLLTGGAPIVRETPENVFFAPSERQIDLFELLVHFGWTVNTPSFYGKVLLPMTVTRPSLLLWFLDHGANPNLGQQQYSHERYGGSNTASCAALEAAAARGQVDSVRMLLETGARIHNGVPLHFAAGACPPGMNPHAGRVAPSQEFDIGRIPVMALLVQQGADVNQKEESRHMAAQYAIVCAVMAGAVERVKWLLEHGASPYLRGNFGNAFEYARASGNETMTEIFEEFMKVKR